MRITDLEAGVLGVKRILPLMKGLTWPDRNRIPLSPNESTDHGIVTNENHRPGGWRVRCEDNLAPHEGLDLAPHAADPLVAQCEHELANSNH
jgi:hypothetical protein